MDDAYATRSATELSSAIRNGTTTSRDLLELYLDRIERLNRIVNAVVTLDTAKARTEADQADADARANHWHGPLHGLPITIKDAIEVGGMRSTGGATELRDHVPSVDAPAVAKLKAAGAIVFGKTNVPRWSGDLQTYNEMFGITNNPWDVTRTPGGSSGGAATAVASGFTSFELGTDIGGSVRMPAHLCGIFGLKPTYGIVSQRGYLDSVGGGTTDADINAFGPLARSADDLDLLLQITAGPNTTDAAAWSLQLPPSTTKPLNALRIGVWLDGDGAPPLADDVRAVIENAIAALRDAGAHIERVHPSIDFATQRDLFFHLLTAATSPSMPYGDHDASGSHLEWLRAQQARAALAASWRQWFDTFDALLCPVMTTAAFEHDNEIDFLSRTLTINGLARPHTDCVAWTGLIGVVGLPAAVPPIGRTAQGLPVGVQVVTAPYHDREAIRIAKLVSETCDGGYVIPPLMA